MKRTVALRVLAAAAAGTFALSACGSSDSSGGSTAGFKAPDVPMVKSLGTKEGAVNILAWPGYAEDGSNDPAYDWVTPFEKDTGCKATVKYFGSSDEALNLMKSGDYDVVSASGDATLRLIAGGYVQPVNTDLLKNFADIRSFLKNTPYNSVDGQMYGMPQGWGATCSPTTRRSSSRPRRAGPTCSAPRPLTRARSRPTTRRSTSPTPPWS